MYDHGSPFSTGAYWGEGINRALALVCLMWDLLVPWIHSVATSLDPEHIIGMDLLSYWKSPHSGSLIHRTRTFVIGKAKCKPLRLPPPTHTHPSQKKSVKSWGNGRNDCHS